MSRITDEAACAHAESLYGRCTACGMTWEQQTEARRQLQPIASRERVAEVLAASIAKQTILDGANLLHPRSADEVGGTFADALIAAGLFREPPTRDQFAILLHSFDGFAIETGERWSDCNEDRQGAFLYQADAVLALIGGDAKSECGATDRTGERRCVFTPGHHEVEDWTSHGDRGGWTWNDQPADVGP